MRSTVRPDALLLALLVAGLAVTMATGRSSSAVAGGGGFIGEQIVTGLTSPTDLAFAPDGRIFIAQQSGRVRIFKNGQLLLNPFIQLPANAFNERGLLGIALDPNFATNGYVYLYYVFENDPANYSGPKTAQLLRVSAGGDVAVPGSEYVLLGSVVGDATHPSCSYFPVGSDCIPATNGSHNGGGLRFAADGTVFLAIGDAETGLPAQDLNSFSGKLVRINPDGTAPPDNPFFTGDPNALRSKLWAYGLRNPFRIAIQPGSGVPFIGDVGAALWEEIDLGQAGANYGWPCYENTVQETFGPVCQALYNAGTQTLPLYSYSHPPGAAVMAGVFYQGINYPPEFQDALFFGDYVRNTIWSLKVDTNNQLVPGSVTEVVPAAQLPVSFAIGPEGNVYYLSLYGKIYRIRYAAGNRPPVAVASASPTVGLAPLAVQFDGHASFDRDLEPISFLWDFGEGNTSTEANPFHVFSQDGDYAVTLTVTDGEGATGTDTVGVTVGDFAPVATITAPAFGLIYEPGESVAFLGEATDFEDGALSGTSLGWEIILRHCEVQLGSCHTHPYWQASGTGGIFATDDQHASGFDFFFHDLSLTATDSLGVTDTASVIISPDTDHDGLSDYTEFFSLSLDLFDADSDDDGLSDGAEVNTYGTNPLDADSDDDALSDGAEVNTYSTDPLDADSDNDTLADGAEVNTYGTNPLDGDSDDDTLPDGAEVNTYGTNPLDADSDDDTLADGAEVNTYGTSPLDADSEGDGMSDAFEVANSGCGLSPLVNDAAADADADALSNLAEVSLGTDVCVADSDGDGCSDGQELGPVPQAGGERDPRNPWDYFNPTQDGFNRTDDVTAVIRKYGHDAGDPLYGSEYDRTALMGGYPWQFGPPNGSIRTSDITAAVLSYGHDCS